ncbi:MAG: hypothetical protein QOI08_3395, partial [Actinomycetota bacterium]|nr:hypothetical protein [Actinomycetota bacterium]
PSPVDGPRRNRPGVPRRRAVLRDGARNRPRRRRPPPGDRRPLPSRRRAGARRRLRPRPRRRPHPVGQTPHRLRRRHPRLPPSPVRSAGTAPRRRRLRLRRPPPPIRPHPSRPHQPKASRGGTRPWTRTTNRRSDEVRDYRRRFVVCPPATNFVPSPTGHPWSERSNESSDESPTQLGHLVGVARRIFRRIAGTGLRHALTSRRIFRRIAATQINNDRVVRSRA